MDVRLTEIVMQFPGTRALDGVSVRFRDDEVHGLIGENGAGKSTLVNILGGSLQPSEGAVVIGDQPVRLASPHDALSVSGARTLKRSTARSGVMVSPGRTGRPSAWVVEPKPTVCTPTPSS